MKKHSSKLLLMFLVIVLCLCIGLFAACNPDNEPPENENNNSVATGTMLNEIISRISSSMSFGESFGADVAASFVVDDKTAADKDVSFKLTFKGNANGKADANEDETNLALELVKEEGQNKETLFGIAYEAIDDEPYFFVNLLGGGYKKINGYSLAALYKMTQNSASAAEDNTSAAIISTIAGILFGEEGTVENNVYTLKFDLAHVVSEVVKQKDTILLALGMSEDDLNAIIADVLGGLSYEHNGQTVNVSDLKTLERFFKVGMSFKGNLVFRFDANNKFQNAEASFDYADQKEDKANYALKVEKALIGKFDTAVDTFNDFALTKEEREAAQAFNLLNFSMSGTATAYDADGELNHNYSINVESDLDAFALLNLLDGTDKANIVAVLKQLGYFHLEINEIFDKADSADSRNIITLHSKFDEGFAVVNFKPYDAVPGSIAVGIGGVYDFDALIDVIGMMGEGGDEPSDPDQPADSLDIKAIINTIKDMLAFFTFDNIQENGVTVELKDLMYKVCELINFDTQSNPVIGSAINNVVGCDSMNIKLQTPTFGTCAQVETETIVCTIRDKFSKAKNDFIKEIKSIDTFSGQILQNDNSFDRYISGTLEYNKAYAMTGVNLKGEEVATTGFIMGVKGLNFAQVGNQNVTMYVGIGADLMQLLGNVGMSLDDLIPLYGVLKYETTVEVLAYDEQAEVTLSGVKTADQNENVGNKTAFGLITSGTPKMTIGTYGTYTLDSSMLRLYDAQEGGNDVTADVLDADGKFAEAGEYYVVFEMLGYSASCCKISVTDTAIVRVDGKEEQTTISLGGSWEYSEYLLYNVDSKGNETLIENPGKSMVVGGTTIKNATKDIVDQYFDVDGNVYTLKKNLAWNDLKRPKTFEIRFTAPTGTKFNKSSVKVVMTIVSDYSFTKYPGTVYFGQSLNNAASLTIAGVQYGIVYKDSKWVAVAEDGTEKTIELNFTWNKSGEAVEFNAGGFISNAPNENKSGARSNKIDYSFKVDGYYYDGYFNFSELKADDKSNAQIDSTLNSYINGLDKIPYLNEDGENATLEFKYGPQGYALYIKDTDVKAYDVTVTVTKGEEAYELTDGKFTEAGTYNVTYSLTVNGVEQTFSHDVTVVAE